MEKFNQKFWNIFDKFIIAIPCSATYSLEVGALVSLKVTNKASPRGKKNSENWEFYVVFVKPKRRSVTGKFQIFLINLASL